MATISSNSSAEPTHLCKVASEATGIAEMVENYAAQWAAAADQENNNLQQLSCSVIYETCECCGLSEECTRAYAERMRAISCGCFVCGLCAEAVKEEMSRMGEGSAMEDALHAHMNMCAQFKSAPRLDPVVHLASALRQILKRSVQDSRSPKTTTSRTKQWERAGLSRSESCMDLRPHDAAAAGPGSSSSSST